MITINIPSQLPALTGNSLLYLRVNLAENGIEWAATAGGNITIGTTAIASGTVNRILFEGAGNVVQQDSNFVWNNTDKRLILGTEAVADANSRLVVIGKDTGTNTTFAVHNSTGTNNALVVRNDGFVGIGTTTPRVISPTSSVGLSIVNGGDNYFSLFSEGAVLIGRGAGSNIAGISANQIGVAIGLNATANRNGIAIGANAIGGLNSVAIGVGAVLSSTSSSATQNILIGNGSLITGVTNNSNNIIIGYGNALRGNDSFISIGQNVGSRNASGGAALIRGLFIGGFVRDETSANGTTIQNISLGWGVDNTNFASSTISNSFNLYFGEQERSFFVNKNSNIVLRSLQALTAGTQYDANATNTLTLHNGTAPATNIADAFQQYSADITAGNAAPHFRTENGDIVKIYRVGGWGLPTGSFTRTTFDTTTVTLEQLAERVAALIQDFRDNHQLLKA